MAVAPVLDVVILDSDDETEPTISSSPPSLGLQTPMLGSDFFNLTNRLPNKPTSHTLSSFSGGIDVPRPISATIPLSMILPGKRKSDQMSGPSSNRMQIEPCYEPVVIAPDNIIDRDDEELHDIVEFGDEDTDAAKGDNTRKSQTSPSSSKRQKQEQSTDETVVSKPETFETKTWVVNTNICKYDKALSMSKDIESMLTSQKFEQETAQIDTAKSEAFETKIWVVNTNTNIGMGENDKAGTPKDIKSSSAYQKVEQNMDQADTVKSEAFETKTWIVNSNTNSDKSNAKLQTENQGLQNFHGTFVKIEVDGQCHWVAASRVKKTEKEEDSDENKSKVALVTDVVSLATAHPDSNPTLKSNEMISCQLKDADIPIAATNSSLPLSSIATAGRAENSTESQTAVSANTRARRSNDKSLPRDVSAPATRSATSSSVASSAPRALVAKPAGNSTNRHPRSTSTSSQPGRRKAATAMTNSVQPRPAEVSLRRGLEKKVVLNDIGDKIHCGACSRKFFALQCFIEHFDKSHCVEPLFCPFCHKKFYTLAKCISHFVYRVQADAQMALLKCVLKCSCGHVFKAMSEAACQQCNRANALVEANKRTLYRDDAGSLQATPFPWCKIEEQRLAVKIEKKINKERNCQRTFWTISVSKMDKSALLPTSQNNNSATKTNRTSSQSTSSGAIVNRASAQNAGAGTESSPSPHMLCTSTKPGIVGINNDITSSSSALSKVERTRNVMHPKLPASAAATSITSPVPAAFITSPASSSAITRPIVPSAIVPFPASPSLISSRGLFKSNQTAQFFSQLAQNPPPKASSAPVQVATRLAAVQHAESGVQCTYVPEVKPKSSKNDS